PLRSSSSPCSRSGPSGSCTGISTFPHPREDAMRRSPSDPPRPAPRGRARTSGRRPPGGALAAAHGVATVALALALPAAFARAGAARAQQPAEADQPRQTGLREVVSKLVEVGRSDATLELELADGETVEASFREGTVALNGEALGSYVPGGG